MDSVSIDGHCTNCAIKFRSASQIFNKITVIQEVTTREIEILDAVLYIYGFSASNMARAYLEDAGQENMFDRISETSDYIYKHGLSLCTSCVSAFKKVYVAHSELKSLSNDMSILSKTIKAFSPNFIKIENEQAEEYKWKKAEIEEDSDNVSQPGSVHLKKIPPEPSVISNAQETENLFRDFNFENNCVDNYENEFDIKPDPVSDADIENVLDAVETVDSEPEEELQKPSRKIRRRRDKEFISNITTKKTKRKVIDESRRVQYEIRRKDLPSKRGHSITSRTADLSKQQPYTASGIYLTRRAACHFNVEIPKLGPDLDQQPVIKPKRIPTEEEQHRKRISANITRKIRKRGRKKRTAGWQLIKLQMLKEAEDLKVQRSKECNENTENVLCDQANANSSNDGSSSQKSVKRRGTTGCYRKRSILSCSCCEKTFRSLTWLRHHEIAHELGAMVICDICGESFSRNYLLYEHKRKQHKSELPEIPLKCNICDESCHSISDLKNHKKQVHPKSKKEKNSNIILKCTCGVIRNSLRGLQAHEKIHETQEPVMCDICGVSFTKNYKLYGHKSIDHLELPQLHSTCQLCDAKFLSLQRLKIHLSQHHSTSDMPFICDKCGRSYSCLIYLRRHERSAHGDEGLAKESFKCGECGIFLKNSTSLKNHMMRMHGPPKIFICPQCGKTTKNMTNMRIHMKVHDPNRTVKGKTSTLAAETSIENNKP